MEFGPSLCCDQLSGVLVLVEACNLCTLDPPTNCSTKLSSEVKVAPTFDPNGVLVLHMLIAEDVEPTLDDDMLDWSGTAPSATATAGWEGEPIARRDGDMAVGLFDEETKFKGNGACV